ncbi:3-oxoacyl-ACP reductase FabG [Micromonospora sp. RTGN7]|uniref:3-oxoacyl-ACP reductase FabG n=1 Tax=Micromonospora sp. RTGN7 TaxID=3016526 RepID=UPI0029FF020A|nr:3-oxoacyl-ACP reductase FabG [Micromonospora sp. RTGN7]
MTAPKVAMVSGGSRGIGRATVLRLARDGYDVSLSYRRDTDAAALVAKQVEEMGRRVQAVRADIADRAAVQDWADRTERELGPVDVAVASAGVIRDRPLAMMSDEEWRDVIDTNLGGVYHLCRVLVLRMTRRRSGCLINISSVAGVHGVAGQTNYSAAKAGIIGFSRALAKEVGRYQVRVNVVAPGYIETDMLATVPEAAREKALTAVPLGRAGRPEEVADLVAYLADERASYISGAVVQIDGAVVL